ncbi:G patch domain-containing protein 11 isoform X1 [Amborella trichopoda]|nr:G patch domain-containing protein 11 isoform X1 [Amborella trichopoda]|eukprot:XP_006850049.2 G patch domain-containing protein 11 isoform X1 [Amborella trichopoda]
MAEEEEDYMGDLSQFLPPETSHPSLSKMKQVENKRHPKRAMNWQERRKLKREKQQQEGDEEILAKSKEAVPSSNIGFKMLQQMGYKPGGALGKKGQGRTEPVGLEIKRSRAGLGSEDPQKLKAQREIIIMERTRRKEESLMAEYGDRQKNLWRNRSIYRDYKKAQAALGQLEGTDVLELEKGNNEEEKDEEKEEEEEEVITEEDLQDILMKLRDEHNYCLYCGCKYESGEALLSNCPGIEEDDH